MPALAPNPLLGPGAPIARLPARIPGSVRRTTTIDMLRPAGLSGDLVLRGVGRDIRTRADGAVESLDHARLDVDIDFLGGRTVRSIRTEPADAAIAGLAGARASSGFRRAAAAAAPQHAAAGDLVNQLLDDVPGASLISGYADTAAGRHETLAAAQLNLRADICAGFQSGGAMLQILERQGWVPMTAGPVAPDVSLDDPDGWPALAAIGPGEVRRRRLLDVSQKGDLVAVFAWFRDTYRQPDGTETIVHEYHVDATVETRHWGIDDIAAVDHVLPWPECPQAAGSARRLVNAPLRSLRDDVRAGFVGTTTCTHLNDQLRSLTDVPVLAAACGRPEGS
jgi:Protein of unknown function (DUF2889)